MTDVKEWTRAELMSAATVSIVGLMELVKYALGSSDILQTVIVVLLVAGYLLTLQNGRMHRIKHHRELFRGGSND